MHSESVLQKLCAWTWLNRQWSAMGQRALLGASLLLLAAAQAGPVLPCSQECVRLSEGMRALCESLDAGGIAAKMFAANVSFARCGPAHHSRYLRLPGVRVITLMPCTGIAHNIFALRACHHSRHGRGPFAMVIHSLCCSCRRHLAVIERFGRFPHRNALLGRQSTAAEAAALADGSVETF